MGEKQVLLEYVRILKKRWLILLFIPFLALVIGCLVNDYLLQPVYRASITTLVGATQNDFQTDIRYDAILANQQLVKTYGEIVKSRSVVEEVQKQLNLNIPIEQLQSQISVTQLSGSELIKVNVESTDPAQATQIANCIGTVFSEKVLTIKKVDSVSIIDSAVIPNTPVRPDRSITLVIAGCIGSLLAIALIMLLEYVDDTLKDSTDIEHHLGLPLLGVIPKLPAAKNEKGREIA